VHWNDYVEHWPLICHLAHQFLSHRMGQMELDIAVFEIVADSIPVAPQNVLFLDDNLANVHTARSLGFQGENVTGVRDARDAFQWVGLL
jgi:FMN phosphatase YigB (HAD superfamily)